MSLEAIHASELGILAGSPPGWSCAVTTAGLDTVFHNHARGPGTRPTVLPYSPLCCIVMLCLALLSVSLLSSACSVLPAAALFRSALSCHAQLHAVLLVRVLDGSAPLCLALCCLCALYSAVRSSMHCSAVLCAACCLCSSLLRSALLSITWRCSDVPVWLRFVLLFSGLRCSTLPWSALCCSTVLYLAVRYNAAALRGSTLVCSTPLHVAVLC